MLLLFDVRFRSLYTHIALYIFSVHVWTFGINFLMFSCFFYTHRLWDDGTANPEPALDQFNMVSPQTALKWLVGGLSVYATVGYLFAADPPEARTPWAPKQNVGIPAEVGASASG